MAKLAVLPLLAGENVTSSFVIPTLASAIDLVVHVQRDRTGKRAISEILGITGRTEGDVVETSQIFVDRGAGLERGSGYVSTPDRFTAHGYDLGELLGSGQWDF